MATVMAPWHDSGCDAELPLRMRTFIRLSTGMLRAGALALSFAGFFWTESFADASSNFVASIVSGALFGIACLLKSGPEAA